MRPVEALLAGYNLLLAWIWLGAPGGAWYAPWAAAAHLAGVGGAWCLASGWARRGRRARGLGLLRDVYPLLSLFAFWTELGHIPGRLDLTYDAQIAWLDAVLFGRHLNLVWMPAMPQTWFSEVMHFVYFAYYPAIFIPPLAALVAGRRAALRDLSFRLMTTYVGCYLVYLTFPVVGPAELLPHYGGPLTEGVFYRLTHAAREAGDSLGTAFPSSHVAGAVTSALIVGRWFPRWVGRVLGVQAFGVILATVYTQNHYAADSLAGLLWAVALQRWAVPALAAVCAARATARRPVLAATRSGRLPEPDTGGAG